MIVICKPAISATLPEYYGVFAVEDNRLVELRKTDTIDKEFGKDVQFLVFDKNIGIVMKAMSIRRLVFVRNLITTGPTGWKQSGWWKKMAVR